jgi:hypothetical protein
VREQEIGVTQTDVFALRNSGLEPILFAEVGDQRSGVGLTVLSLLARLGLDPWAEAARWVTLPRNAAIACLAGNIARMPLSPQALAGAHATATRLILLLPVNNTVPRLAARALPPGLAAMPKWLPMTLLYCALAVGLGVANMISAPGPGPTTTTLSNDQAVHQPR